MRSPKNLLIRFSKTTPRNSWLVEWGSGELARNEKSGSILAPAFSSIYFVSVGGNVSTGLGAS